MADSIQTIATNVARSAAFLETAVRTRDAANLFLNTLGWELPPGIDDIGLTAVDLTNLVAKMRVLLDARIDAQASGSVGADGGEAEIDVGLYADVLVAFARVLHDLVDLADRLPTVLPADYIARTHIDSELFPRLTSITIMQLVGKQIPIAYQLLTFLGIFNLEPHDADAPNYQVQHIRHVIRWDRLGTLFSDPSALFHDVYGWGTPAFNAVKLLSAFGHLMGTIGLPGRLRDLPRRVEERLAGVPVPDADAHPMPQLLLSILRGIGWNSLDVGVSLFGVRPTLPGGADGGVGLFPYAHGTAELIFPLTDVLKLELATSLDLDGGIVVSVRPSQPVRTQIGVTSGGAVNVSASGSLGLTLRYRRDGARTVLLSFGDSGKVDLNEFYATLGVGLVASTAFDFFFEAGLKGMRLVVGGGEGDGFLQKILPPDGITAEFDLIAGWAGSRGVYFQGSAALEIQLPVHIAIGPISLDSVTIMVRFQDGKIPIEASTGITATLGPLVATVERLGLIAEFSFPDNGGNLGPADLALKFKPPNGVGLSIDTGIVKGGGFLLIDPDRGEYAGALELVFSGFLNLKAIGIITTRMPDGSTGFSLLIIITVEFGTGIQLGFGFTLLAVGGLLGLNRTMRLQPMVDGVRTGSVNAIMFPENVVANITRILSDLRAYFPPEEGKFLIGPMAKLGWGTPTLVSLSLGIIIEIPGNIALLGVLRVVLPANAVTVIVLQVSFIGAVEFDKRRFYFFASLYESRILFITLEGEMGVLAAFGDDANFVISVGGFHPQFNPPPLPFPVPRRISVSILNESWASIRAEGYFAVTTNTFQFGTFAQARFGFSSFGIEGHLGFDALVQFSPLYFIVSISAGFSIKVFGMGLFGIDVRFSLEGPTPWRARGTGSISFFFFSIDVDFDFTWGERRDTSLPAVAVMPLLEAEFQRQDNWRAQLPAGANLLVSLRKLDTEEAAMVLHPLGALRVVQQLAPLELTIDKLGNQKPSDANRFSLSVVSSGLTKRGDVNQSFAAAQFKDLDDAAKLSRPAYEPMPGGLELSVTGSQLASGAMVKRVVRYDLITIDTNFRRFGKRFLILSLGLFQHFLGGAAITNSVLSKAQRSRLDPFEEKIVARPESFVVALQSTNAPLDPAATFTSEAQARDYMARHVAANPEMEDALHVIPQSETAA